MRAVRKHTDCPWALLYIERWLAAPVQLPDGSLIQPEKGVPQGAVLSPVLSNLFLHYAFDVWMTRYQADIRFERYADEFITRVYDATIPAVALLGAVAVAWAWRMNPRLRAAAAAMVTAAAVQAFQQWLSWIV